MPSSFPWLRALLFAAIVAHMQAGPLWGQALRLGHVPLGMEWRMYSGKGTDICEVAWSAPIRSPAGNPPASLVSQPRSPSAPRPDGELARVDSMAVLGHATWWRAPPQLRRQRSEEDLRRVARQLCDKGGFTSLHASARCAVRGRWQEVLQPDVDLCARPAR